MTTKELAAVLGCSIKYALALCQSRRVECRKINGRWDIPEQDFEEIKEMIHKPKTIRIDILHDRERLLELYTSLGKNRVAVAEVCQCSPYTIYEWLNRHEIKVGKTDEPGADKNKRAAPHASLTIRQLAEQVVHNAYIKAGKCPPNCPVWEEGSCLREDSECYLNTG